MKKLSLAIVITLGISLSVSICLLIVRFITYLLVNQYILAAIGAGIGVIFIIVYGAIILEDSQKS